VSLDPFGLAGLADPLDIEPLLHPIDADAQLPGSKSITNRALVIAALAEGDTTLEGALFADDTEAMLGCLRDLGLAVHRDPDASRVTVTGGGGALSPGAVTLDARLSGTTSRFVLPLLALSDATVVLDGGEPLRARPMADGIAAVQALGAVVEALDAPGHLPIRVRGTADPARAVRVPGSVSSQFLSGLLLVAPCLPSGLEVTIVGDLVSRPYVELTLHVMRAFGAEASWATLDRITVAPTGYRGRTYTVEPDASAASYAMAAAAIAGGSVRVAGLGRSSPQGDVRFADVLARMGADVTIGADGIEVRGTGVLHGIDVDLGDLSDTAQTFAAVAVFADGPSEVTGIGFIRAKETDRIAAVVTELVRCGVDAVPTPDGFRIVPGPPSPAVIETYDDHRMAMSFALLGLRASGIRIADPACVAKTFPGYWAFLDSLHTSSGGR